MNLYKRVFPKWTYDPFVAEHKQKKPSSLSGSGFVTAPDTLQLTKKKISISKPDEETME